MLLKTNSDIQLNVIHCTVMKRLLFLPAEGLSFSKKGKLVVCVGVESTSQNFLKEEPVKYLSFVSNKKKHDLIGENKHEAFKKPFFCNLQC